MNEDKVLAGLSCCIEDGGDCTSCPYRKRKSKYECHHIQMLRESKEAIEIKNKLIDFLIAEGGMDCCSKCIYRKTPDEIIDDDCACKQEELEGVKACRRGMMAYFAEVKS